MSQPVITPVYQYHADNPWRYQYSSNPDIGSGWTRDPLSRGFFAFGKTPGALPVYQYHSSDSSFLYSIKPDIGWPGWTRGAIAFYAFEKEGVSTIPVYQFRASSPLRHMYSTDPSPRPDWTLDGVVFHVFAATPAGSPGTSDNLAEASLESAAVEA